MERGLLGLVVAVAVIAIGVPGPGRALADGGSINIVLAVLVFVSALSIPDGAWASLRRAGPSLVVVLVAATVLLPLVALLAGLVISSHGLRHGVLTVGVAPAEVASVGITGIAGGDVAIAASLLVASVVISVALAGPILSVLAGAHVASGHVLVTLALVVGLPLVIGLLTRRARITPVVAEAAEVVSILAVLILVELVASQVRPSASYGVATAVLVAIIGLSAALGTLLGRRLEPGAATAVLLHVSMRDFAVASGIASAAFGSTATGPLGIYGVLVIGWGALVAHRSASRD